LGLKTFYDTRRLEVGDKAQTPLAAELAAMVRQAYRAG
jgi:hypothetical protein